MSEVEVGNLYEINKQLSSKEKPLDIIQVNRRLNEIAESFYQYSKYCMLLCHEQRDYTLFNITQCSHPDNLKNEIKETLFNRGEVISISRETTDNGDIIAWEIWIRANNEDFCYYLFDYDFGVVEVK